MRKHPHPFSFCNLLLLTICDLFSCFMIFRCLLYKFCKNIFNPYFRKIQFFFKSKLPFLLMYQIKIGILKREWSFGDGLPSVRSLASELGINMHTVNKAYNLLADEGVLVKNQKGYFVSERAMIASNEATKAAMQDKLKEILIDKQIFEVTDETFREWLNEIEKALKGEGKTHADL